MRLNPAISKLIGIIFLIAFACFFIWIAFFVEHDPEQYDATYDGREGIITVELENPLPEGTWTAYVYTYDSDNDKVDICQDAKVTPSQDRKTLRITDPSGALYNLQNGIYHMFVSSGQTSFAFTFHVTDHETTTDEYIVIGVVLAVLIIAFVIAFIRRLNRGHW